MEFTLSQYLESYIMSYANIENAEKAEVRFECYSKDASRFDGYLTHEIKSMFQLNELGVPFIMAQDGMFAFSMFHITKVEIERYAKKSFEEAPEDIYFILVKDCDGEFHWIGVFDNEDFATHRFINVDPLNGHLYENVWAKGLDVM